MFLMSMLLRGPNQRLRLDMANFGAPPPATVCADFPSEIMDGFGFMDKQGQPPTPRSHHASAILGNSGYISGGVVSVFTQLSTASSPK